MGNKTVFPVVSIGWIRKRSGSLPSLTVVGCARVHKIGRMRLMKALHHRGLARMIHDRFCCNRRSAATASLRPTGLLLGPSPYCTSTHQILRSTRAGLATRLNDFATNCHE